MYEKYFSNDQHLKYDMQHTTQYQPKKKILF